MAEQNVRWPQDATQLTQAEISPSTPLMAADGTDEEKLAYITHEQLADSITEIIEINGIEVKPIAGGASSATPTILAPGPAGQNRKMEDVVGWFINGTADEPPVATGEPWEAPAGYKNVNWWDSTTWSLGSSVELPVDPNSVKKDDVSTTYSNLYNPNNNVVGKYVGSTGVIAESAGTILNIQQVTAGSSYVVNADSLQSNAFYIGFRDSSNVDNGEITLATLSPTLDPNTKTFVVPDGYTHAFINLKLPNVNWDITSSFILQEGTELQEKRADKILDIPLLDDGAVRKADVTGISPLYFPSNNVTGRYVNPTLNGGSIASSSTAVMNIFPVTAGKTYAVKCDSFTPGAFYIAFRDNPSTEVGPIISIADIQSTNDPDVRIFEAAQGAKYAFINITLPGLGFDIVDSVEFNEGGFIVTESTANKIDGKNIEDAFAREKLSQIEQGDSKLKKLRWILIGDSITEKNYRSNENYHYYLAQMVGGMTRYNYGISGSGFFNRFDVADTITQLPEEIDLISLFWGTNDWGNQNAANQKQLGTFLDTGTTTISGCINTCLTKLIAKFPTKPIVLFTPLPRANNWGLNAANNSMGYTLKQFSDLLIKYANHFSLPILDLYSESGLFPWNADANDYFFKAPDLTAGDGLHPNDEGHKWIANKIKVFLETSIRVAV